jgi:hypothetical protein
MVEPVKNRMRDDVAEPLDRRASLILSQEKREMSGVVPGAAANAK